MNRRIQPFPWGSLEAMSRADVVTVAALRRWGEAHARLGALAAEASALVEAPVEISLRRVSSRAAAGALDDAVAVVLTPGAGPHDLRRAVLVEAEGALAVSLAARALRRKPPALHDRGRAMGTGVAGAFGAICTAACRRANAGNPLRVAGAGPAAALMQDLATATGDLAVASFTVMVGDDAFLARAAVPRAAMAAAPPAPWTRESLRALGGVPMSIPIVACTSVCPAAELGALRLGDAWMPGTWPLAPAADGVLAGDVTLIGAANERGLAARIEVLGAGGRLVLGGEVRDLPWSPEANVTGSHDTTDALIESLGEVPVVVRVEIGAAQMPARAWADVGPGDVVALGRRIAEPVVLRVGGVEVARGELVDIEGEVGVRILERSEATAREGAEVMP